MTNELILASTSIYRKNLLERLKIPFEIIPANIDETAKVNESANKLVERLAKEKALIVATKYPEKWVVGSDQVAHISGAFLTKPGNHLTAFKQLINCSGKQIQFITGVALVNFEKQIVLYGQSHVDVKFLDLSEQQVESYLYIDKPYDCAGSFKVESLGISLFEWVKSDDPTSLEGLPLILVCQLLRKAGFEL